SDATLQLDLRRRLASQFNAVIGALQCSAGGNEVAMIDVDGDVLHRSGHRVASPRATGIGRQAGPDSKRARFTGALLVRDSRPNDSARDRFAAAVDHNASDRPAGLELRDEFGWDLVVV